jgi:hypothetical protein
MVPQDLQVLALLVPGIISRMALFDFPKCTYRVCLRKSVNSKSYMNILNNYREEDML